MNLINNDDILAFVRWRQDNRWYNYNISTDKYYQTLEHPTAMSKKSYEKNHTKTREELIQLFLKDITYEHT